MRIATVDYGQLTVDYRQLSLAKSLLSLVDVYLPTYQPNNKYLQEALASLFAQSEQRWQLWIHDEPTDVDTKSLLGDVLNDPRVRFARNTERLGIGGNWNACLQHGSAPYIQYLFQDDIWEPTFLENGIKVLEAHPDVGFVSLDHLYVFEKAIGAKNSYEDVLSILRSEIQPGKHHGSEMLLWWTKRCLHPNVIREPSFVLLRRSAVEQTGKFDENMKQILDVEYWVRMLENTNWYYLQGNFGSFRVHSEGTSSKNHKNLRNIVDYFILLIRALRILSGKNRIAAIVGLLKNSGKISKRLFLHFVRVPKFL